MVNAEQLDAARDVALRCARSHAVFVLHANSFFDLAYSPKERQTKLAADLRVLAMLLGEGRNAISPEVNDAILRSSGDGPPPPAESTWHGLAVGRVQSLVLEALRCAALDGLRPSPLRFLNNDDADRLSDIVFRFGAAGIHGLLKGYQARADELEVDVEAGINREWGATRKMLAPPKPAIPHKLLKGWYEICAALDMPHSQRNDVKSLNHRCEGPITNRGKGTQPMVYLDALLGWWNGLAVMQAEKGNERLGRQLSAEEQYAWGRSGTAAPGVQGGVKRRRSDRT